jgi:hypothetical protein
MDLQHLNDLTLERPNRARHARNFDNSDCTSRSCIIFPGIDIGYGSPSAKRVDLLQTPAPLGGTLVTYSNEIPYRPSLYQGASMYLHTAVIGS